MRTTASEGSVGHAKKRSQQCSRSTSLKNNCRPRSSFARFLDRRRQDDRIPESDPQERAHRDQSIFPAFAHAGELGNLRTVEEGIRRVYRRDEARRFAGAANPVSRRATQSAKSKQALDTRERRG